MGWFSETEAEKLQRIHNKGQEDGASGHSRRHPNPFSQYEPEIFKDCDSGVPDSVKENDAYEKGYINGRDSKK